MSILEERSRYQQCRLHIDAQLSTWLSASRQGLSVSHLAQSEHLLEAQDGVGVVKA